MRIAAVIGSVGHSNETLIPLVEQLDEEGILVAVLDNRGTLNRHDLPIWVDYANVEGMNIHQVWNRGMNIAQLAGADWCCVLNDDITLDPGAPRIAAAACPEDVWIAGFDYEGHEDLKLRDAGGSYRLHGVGGFAFMIRPEVGLRYDSRFQWWGGDDDLIWECLARGGRAVVVEGANVSHPDGGNTSGRFYPELMEKVGADRELLMEKWNKAW
jgi:hypothetical protein